jgi:hypothetical protein
VTEPRSIFGSLALRLLAPDPLEGRLTTLAKSQAASAVIPIGKSWWKLGLLFAILLFAILGIVALIYIDFLSGNAFATLFVYFPFLLLVLFCLQPILRIAICKSPPLVLDTEGLRVNLTGDFIRYDQIANVDFQYIEGMGSMWLTLVPGVKLKSGRTRFGTRSLFNFSVLELAGEIERRMKIAAPKTSVRGK